MPSFRKLRRSVVTFQKPFSIRGNVVSNPSYKDWVCQLSSETNKPFLTSCPPTITSPKESKTVIVEQTTYYEVNRMHCYCGKLNVQQFPPLAFPINAMWICVKEKKRWNTMKYNRSGFSTINIVSLMKFLKSWRNVQSLLRSMGLWTGSTDCRGLPQISSVSGTPTILFWRFATIRHDMLRITI